MTSAVKPPTLDDLLPEPHFRERHERCIKAPPPAVWIALHELRLVDLPLSRALMDIRTLPARLLGRERPRTVTPRLLEDGPVPVIVSDPERAVLAGAALQPWKLVDTGESPALDAAGLRAFEEPGWVKVGIDFVLEPCEAGTRLHTETRVRATDRRTRARFGLYWLAIRAGSGLIRRDLLREVARRTEGEARAPVKGEARQANDQQRGQLRD